MPKEGALVAGKNAPIECQAPFDCPRLVGLTNISLDSLSYDGRTTPSDPDSPTTRRTQYIFLEDGHTTPVGLHTHSPTTRRTHFTNIDSVLMSPVGLHQ